MSGLCNASLRSSDNTLISDSTVSSNSAYYGGGIYNSSNATLTTISSSTFSGNSAVSGGGVYNAGGTYSNSILTSITNTTFSANSATFLGGGIYNQGELSTLLNSTFSGNSASSGGGLNIHTSAVGTLINSIFTNTISGGDCALVNGGAITAANNNLSSDDSCPGDIGDITNFDDALEDNGCVIPGANGCVKTHALLAGSNAINAAVNGTANDQRGFPAKGIRDIGAYESEFTPGGCLPYTPDGKTLMICW